MQLYSVKSHNESRINNDVDEEAKTASQFLQIIGWYGPIATGHDQQSISMMLPYEFISYQQMKKEVKHKALLLQYKRWNQYKYNKRR